MNATHLHAHVGEQLILNPSQVSSVSVRMSSRQESHLDLRRSVVWRHIHRTGVNRNRTMSVSVRAATGLTRVSPSLAPLCQESDARLAEQDRQGTCARV